MDRRDFLRRALFGGVALAVSGPIIEKLCSANAVIERTPSGILFAAYLDEETTIIDAIAGPANIVEMNTWCEGATASHGLPIEFFIERVEHEAKLLSVLLHPRSYVRWVARAGGEIIVKQGQSIQLRAVTKNHGLEVCGQLLTREMLSCPS